MGRWRPRLPQARRRRWPLGARPAHKALAQPRPGRLGGPATDTRGRRRRGRTLTMKSRAKLSSPLWSGLFMACTRWMNLLRISTCSILPPPSPRRPPARRSARSVFPSSLRPGPPSPPPFPARPPRRGGCGCGGTGRASPRNLKERLGFPQSQASRGLAPAPTPSRPHPPSPPSSVRAAAASGTRLSARPAPFPVLPFPPHPPASSRSRLSPRARPRRHPDARARAAAPPHERRTRRRLSPAGPAPRPL